MPSAAQPTVGQNGARLSPKCQGLGGAVKEANRIAVPRNATLCSSVATTVKVALLSSLDVWPVAAATIAIERKVITRPTPKPAGAYQAGQRGCGSTPSGSSGRSGGGWVSVVCISAQSTDGSCASERIASTPGGAAPSRASRIGRMPAARAPSTSFLSESPTCTASAASTPASSSARSKTAGAGLAAPASAELDTPSTSSNRPDGPSQSGSEQSQLLAITSFAPAPRSSRSAGSASG